MSQMGQGQSQEKAVNNHRKGQDRLLFLEVVGC